MPSSKLAAAVCSALAVGLVHVAVADSHYDYGSKFHKAWSHDRHYGQARSFQRIATVPNYRNNADRGDETVSEIVSATKDGKTLVYTDGELGTIGLIDIADPYAPASVGIVDVGGEPTSVSVLGNRYALVGINTSESFVEPGGHLAVVDLHERSIVVEIPLGGQPDSSAISADERYAAVVIENERDEEVCVGGTNDNTPVPEDDDAAADACEAGGGSVGIIPQNGPDTAIGNPAGYLAIVDLIGQPQSWTVREAQFDLPSHVLGHTDPEPEFVDINYANQAVVTLQENNYIAIVDLKSGATVEGFQAGSVDLADIDTEEEDIISLDGSLSDLPREPDAVTWVPYGRKGSLIATANEGDMFGGSRGFTIFDKYGAVVYDSGNELEHIAVRHGHYPEGRSENKGTEPEAIEFGRFGHDDYLFVGTERASFIAVYELNRFGSPEFKQLLPGPLGPEGLLAIPSRNLLVVSGENDDPELGVRSSVMIYELKDDAPSYPQILSDNDADGKPIPWSALSGMASVGDGRDNTMLAVWDSFYAQSAILTIDASGKTARIVDSLPISGGSGNYDPEGIDVAPDGTYWIASEGNASGSRPNRLLQVDERGTVVAEIGLPAEVEACRAASTATGSLGAGFEGVAVVSRSWSWHRKSTDYVLLVAQQRGWDYTTAECEDLDDDALGLKADGEPRATRIWIYDPKAGEWDHVSWELADEPANAAWVGLSEITKVPGGYVVLERDNRTGDFAELKTLVNFSGHAADDGWIHQSEKHVYDLLPDLLATNGWITDKPEGVAVTRGGDVYVVTDNDGVDDWSGETWFFKAGNLWKMFW